jgi:imidazole glycerol-phosphate synthase subunit HisF
VILPRVIPCLLVRDKGLVKTVKFKDHKYIGDPINAVRIFNEKQVDELIILDIDASVLGRDPDYRMIQNIASECRMPLCYGGGINSVDKAKKILSLGVEKIAMSSAAIKNMNLVNEMVAGIGGQSVVVILDVKRKMLGGYEVVLNNGTIKTGHSPIRLVAELQQRGVGEIVINSVDNDGVMKGYDYDLIDEIKKIISVPMTILGGAGSSDDLQKAVDRYGIIGVSAGSLFVYKGNYKGVLINYPLPFSLSLRN